jgi:hypothetical protein
MSLPQLRRLGVMTPLLWKRRAGVGFWNSARFSPLRLGLRYRRPVERHHVVRVCPTSPVLLSTLARVGVGFEPSRTTCVAMFEEVHDFFV